MQIKKIKTVQLFIISIIIILLILPVSAKAEKTTENSSSFFSKGFYIDIAMNGLYPLDSDYRDIYKSFVIYPEIGAGFILSKHFYIFGDFGFYKVEGSTPEWDFALEMSQKLISAGGGYLKQLSDKFGVSVDLGLTYIMFDEKLETIDIENSGNSLGFFIGGKGYYCISKPLNLILKIKYSNVSEDTEYESVNFGGLTCGFGLMFNF